MLAAAGGFFLVFLNLGFGGPRPRFCIRNSFAPYSGRKPQNREKRVSESKKPTPEKGAPSQKLPFFLVVLCIEMGIF